MHAHRIHFARGARVDRHHRTSLRTNAAPLHPHRLATPPPFSRFSCCAVSPEVRKTMRPRPYSYRFLFALRAPQPPGFYMRFPPCPLPPRLPSPHWPLVVFTFVGRVWPIAVVTQNLVRAHRTHSARGARNPAEPPSPLNHANCHLLPAALLLPHLFFIASLFNARA